MARLRILEFPDPRLRTRARPVEVVDDELRQLIDDMFETMYAAPGIGLAATQVDVHKRLLVADVSSEKNDPHVLINPEILELDGKAYSEEGCLSVPGYFAEAERAEHIGLYHRVVPKDDVVSEARTLAERLAKGPSFALEITKDSLNREASMDLVGALEAEAQIQAALMLHPDFRESYDAFVEKRDPNFL